MSKQVLVAEDEEDFAEILKDALGESGYKVLHCSKVGQARTMLANQKFDAIVLDWRLESGTGGQIIDSVRNDSKGFNYKSPIFVTSGFLEKEIVLSIKDRVQGMFVKPFDVDELVKKVNAVCKPPV